jgi:antitoxin MazE
MIVPLIKIGSSKGIRIPRHLIEKCGLGDAVELRVEEGKLVILPDRPSRANWASKFERASVRPAAPSLLGEGITNDFDNEEWEW